ncbi:PssE/Cps14G family polysaccharide biosynthesis glycosyltransferase [Pedobacter fastidiosus]|uniref:Exopolysaccharide biosynthesis protein n=1 Tax=Pedobacter fastidiosus TaxID=2765361 RepID=A0ABR7KVK6_9SPHI|nr:PssE/Cps14G family polysaccharide biosynthesis glycosyltransferase [Pedobacter fastidiosus]MBC6111860.1 exopolysaccharide biosynthesis protein [Pedobacter fastidiosus]
MILVLLGTFKINFNRPLMALEKAMLEGKISDKIIVQAGHTKFDSNVLEIRKFIKSDELTVLYEEAEIIITHSGVGSVLKGLSMNKRIIAIPRLYKFKEHVDDHQLDITEEFSRLGYLIPWRENDDIESLLLRVRTFTPNPFISQPTQINEYIINYIENLD